MEKKRKMKARENYVKREREGKKKRIEYIKKKCRKKKLGRMENENKWS